MLVEYLNSIKTFKFFKSNSYYFTINKLNFKMIRFYAYSFIIL